MRRELPRRPGKLLVPTLAAVTLTFLVLSMAAPVATVVAGFTPTPTTEEPTEPPTEEPTEPPTEEPTEPPPQDTPEPATPEPTLVPTQLPALPETGAVGPSASLLVSLGVALGGLALLPAWLLHRLREGRGRAGPAD